MSKSKASFVIFIFAKVQPVLKKVEATQTDTERHTQKRKSYKRNLTNLLNLLQFIYACYFQLVYCLAIVNRVTVYVNGQQVNV